MSDIDFESVKKEMGAATDPKKLLELALKQAEYDPEGVRKDIRLLDPSCVDTTRAITLKVGSHTFKPLVAYPIFAADYIRGYKNPQLLIEFDEVTLLPFVQFKADAKVRDDAPDAVELLKKFMPADTVYEDKEKWKSLCKKERGSFKLWDMTPVKSFDGYQLHLIQFKTKEETQFLKRMFVFCWFFIEGAQAPDETDETWEVYVATKQESNAFVGYTSVYSFLYYLNAQQFETYAKTQKTVRKRIAHFLILPPFQGLGMGKSLYLELVKHFVADQYVREIEVEEPSSGFEVLRDRAHYEWLTTDPISKALLEEYGDDSDDALAKLIDHFKMDKVQFQRVAEMFIYMTKGQKESRLLKKLIKSRLWEHNYEDLRDMDPATQREQLHRVYENALHTHQVALHLAEPSEEEEEDDDEEDGELTNPAEILLAQLAQGISPDLANLPSEKRRRTE